MLERAGLHQTRFRTPGVAPDARGVVLGEKGLVLFASLDRAVAFLRAYAAQATLDELVPSLLIRRVVTPLRAREIVVTFAAESSYRMDRVAGIARLAGGLVFTGTSRHFVKYRDAASPLGYDVQQLVDGGDLALYGDGFEQTYAVERDVPLLDLVLKLSPEPMPPGERMPEETSPGKPGEAAHPRLLCTAETGIGHALVRYLFRWRVDARVALAEWATESAFDDGPRRAHLFDLRAVPARIVALLRGLPGVRLFVPSGDRVAVEYGYRHPIALDSIPSLFAADSLTLFRADAPAELLSPLPPFAPVRALVRADLAPALDAADATPAAQHARPGAAPPPAMALPLRLRPTGGPFRDVRATVVPAAHGEWLARMLYVLPPRTLAALRIAVTPERTYLLDPAGIEGVPLGTFYSELAPRIFVPAGTVIEPSVPADVLVDLVEGRGDGYVFFHLDAPAPTVVPADAFGPVPRRALRRLAAASASASRLEAEDPGLPLLEYGANRTFPLRGIPGGAAPLPSGDDDVGVPGAGGA
jgi:hypothetical protein